MKQTIPQKKTLIISFNLTPSKIVFRDLIEGKKSKTLHAAIKFNKYAFGARGHGALLVMPRP